MYQVLEELKKEKYAAPINALINFLWLTVYDIVRDQKI